MIELSFLGGLIVGFVIGWQHAKLNKLAKQLEDQPKPEVGATPASYAHINEYMSNQPDKDTGLVMPKTPEQLEWEEAEQLRRAQHGPNN